MCDESSASPTMILQSFFLMFIYYLFVCVCGCVYVCMYVCVCGVCVCMCVCVCVCVLSTCARDLISLGEGWAGRGSRWMKLRRCLYSSLLPGMELLDVVWQIGRRCAG